MLFIGHFSFDEIDSGGEQKHGYLSSLVNAESPEDAISKFEDHIRKLKGSVSAMVNVVNVYIEEILSIAQIPQTPIVTRLQSSDGQFPVSVSHSLTGVEDHSHVEAYGYAPDIENQDRAEEGGLVESEPFITFSG